MTAGRDSGSHEFERTHLIEHLRFAVDGIGAVGGIGAAVPSEIKIAITRLDNAGAAILAAVQREFPGVARVRVTDAPERESGRAYYRCLCFKVYATFGGPGSRSRFGQADPEAAEPETIEVSDGGFVDWTAKLLGNRKERLLISGHGLDRLAIKSRPTRRADRNS